ncbi:MAG: YeeE/YedE thiosulfate transporter family protein [Sphingorhabdus sp.]|nr:YeeE/YedE thiosulfate transporter family protein [Sphingorhabdus sp.]
MISAFPNAMPVEGFMGGLLIGLAAAIMLLGLGRIAGVSGIAARATGIADSGAPRNVAIAIAFVVGLPLGALLIAQTVGTVNVSFPASIWPLIIGGLLVGYGTRLGSGCTSGHGVCGLSRLSPRSMVATGMFMASGFVTVGILRAGGWL